MQFAADTPQVPARSGTVGSAAGVSEGASELLYSYSWIAAPGEDLEHSLAVGLAQSGA